MNLGMERRLHCQVAHFVCVIRRSEEYPHSPTANHQDFIWLLCCEATEQDARKGVGHGYISW